MVVPARGDELAVRRERRREDDFVMLERPQNVELPAIDQVDSVAGRGPHENPVAVGGEGQPLGHRTRVRTRVGNLRGRAAGRGVVEVDRVVPAFDRQHLPVGREGEGHDVLVLLVESEQHAAGGQVVDADVAEPVGAAAGNREFAVRGDG